MQSLRQVRARFRSGSDGTAVCVFDLLSLCSCWHQGRKRSRRVCGPQIQQQPVCLHLHLGPQHRPEGTLVRGRDAEQRDTNREEKLPLLASTSKLVWGTSTRTMKRVIISPLRATSAVHRETSEVYLDVSRFKVHVCSSRQLGSVFMGEAANSDSSANKVKQHSTKLMPMLRLRAC